MGRMIATPKTANRLVFCQYAVCSLLFLTIFGPKLAYYFLLFLALNLSILYLALLAGLAMEFTEVTEMLGTTYFSILMRFFDLRRLHSSHMHRWMMNHNN